MKHYDALRKIYLPMFATTKKSDFPQSLNLKKRNYENIKKCLINREIQIIY